MNQLNKLNLSNQNNIKIIDLLDESNDEYKSSRTRRRAA